MCAHIAMGPTHQINSWIWSQSGCCLHGQCRKIKPHDVIPRLDMPHLLQLTASETCQTLCPLPILFTVAQGKPSHPECYGRVSIVLQNHLQAQEPVVVVVRFSLHIASSMQEAIRIDKQSEQRRKKGERRQATQRTEKAMIVLVMDASTNQECFETFFLCLLGTGSGSTNNMRGTHLSSS